MRLSNRLLELQSDSDELVDLLKERVDFIVHVLSAYGRPIEVLLHIYTALPPNAFSCSIRALRHADHVGTLSF